MNTFARVGEFAVLGPFILVARQQKKNRLALVHQVLVLCIVGCQILKFYEFHSQP